MVSQPPEGLGFGRWLQQNDETNKKQINTYTNYSLLASSSKNFETAKKLRAKKVFTYE